MVIIYVCANCLQQNLPRINRKVDYCDNCGRAALLAGVEKDRCSLADITAWVYCESKHEQSGLRCEIRGVHEGKHLVIDLSVSRPGTLDLITWSDSS